MNILLIIVALTFPQVSPPPDYAKALRPVVAQSVKWMREAGDWTEGPVTVDVDSYFEALTRSGRNLGDEDAFRGRTGVERSTTLAEVIECSSPVMCTGVRDNGLHVGVDSVKFASDTEARLYVTATATERRPQGSAPCTVLLEIGARLNPGGLWVAGDADWIRQC